MASTNHEETFPNAATACCGMSTWPQTGGGGERFASFFFWLAINGAHYFFRYFATDEGDFNVTFLRLFLRLGELKLLNETCSILILDFCVN